MKEIYLNKNIKHLRNLINLSQKEFANEINISLDYVKSLETRNKKPSFDILLNLYNYFNKRLNITMDELLFSDLSNK